jgi:hypothetical protein
MESIRLFSYKMINDSGFAPNPFHGLMTLANCKPCIRRSKKIGDWIAGFTSKELNGDVVDDERLIYLMKITNKVDYYEYWNNPIYNSKIPKLESDIVEYKAGDNIYKPDNINGFVQIENKNHTEKDIKRDLSGEYVLVSNCFYYFGSSAIYIPSDIRPSIHRGQSSQGNRTHNKEKAERFINYIQKNYEQGLIGLPHWWPQKVKKN